MWQSIVQMYGGCKQRMQIQASQRASNQAGTQPPKPNNNMLSVGHLPANPHTLEAGAQQGQLVLLAMPPRADINK
jgi:hypothetical protein